MKCMLILSGILSMTLAANWANASGCGFYENSQTVISSGRVESNDRDFDVLSWNASEALVFEKRTGKTHRLVWQERRNDASPNLKIKVRTNDVLFEEGNGCGPIFRCVTGQIQVIITDPRVRQHIVYSYPSVLDLMTHESLVYASSSPLLPVYGSLKLDVPAISSPDSAMPAPNPSQCGYGNW